MGQRQARRLTADEIEDLLRRNPHCSRDNILSMYRQFRREFPSGYITRESFLRSYTHHFSSASDRLICNQLFNAYDVDGNGRVNFGEFLVNLGVAMHGSTEQKLARAFAMLNVDGDGYLTENEIVKVLEAIYTMKEVGNAADRARTNAKVIMKQLDENGDGRLSYAEFIEAPSRYPYIMKIVEIL